MTTRQVNEYVCTCHGQAWVRTMSTLTSQKLTELFNCIFWPPEENHKA